MSLNADLDAWAKDIVNSSTNSGFSGINVVEKILSDPGISTTGSKHRVLWWPKSKRIAKMSRAMHQIDPISQVCLIVNSGFLMKEDGNSFTLNDLKKNSSLNMGEIRRRIRESKRKLRGILK